MINDKWIAQNLILCLKNLEISEFKIMIILSLINIISVSVIKISI